MASLLQPLIPFEPVQETSIPSGDQWIHQVKWDGVRILTYFDGTTCKLFNRKGNERTYNYPELTEVRPYASVSSVILDGEVIALGADGKPSFHEVMKRDGIRKLERVKTAMNQVPISYMVFDIVYFEGEWVTDRPFAERNLLLHKVIHPNAVVQIVPSFPDGNSLFQLMEQQGMEGIVSKDTNSSYIIKGKDRRWVKIKNYGDLVAVIGGYTLNGGIVNAVLAGVYDQEGKFIYIGHVGTGKMARSEWVRLTGLLKPATIAERPFFNHNPDMKGAYWVTPRLTIKIKFAEWRWKEGRTLRQPSIQAFVDEKPENCIFSFT